MYNDNYNCKTAEECGAVPAPAETMKDVIADTHDRLLKAKSMANDIHGKLFGPVPIPPNGANSEVNCAYDALLDNRGITSEILETLYNIIQKLDG